jgi:hypothetical protein
MYGLFYSYRATATKTAITAANIGTTLDAPLLAGPFVSLGTGVTPVLGSGVCVVGASDDPGVGVGVTGALVTGALVGALVGADVSGAAVLVGAAEADGVGVALQISPLLGL